jgi:hypothetical protein
MDSKRLTQMSLKERVEALNQMIISGKALQAFDTFYAEEVSMQENENEPTISKNACRQNEEAFVNGIVEFRNAEVRDVIFSDNISAVEWDFDFTHKDWGVRKYKQLSVQKWNDNGQINSEKFYYNN